MLDHSYGVARELFKKAVGVLEESVYKSLFKSYRDAFYECEKAKIQRDGRFKWLQDTSAHAEQRFRDINGCWEDLKQTIFWVGEHDCMDIETVRKSCMWLDRYADKFILREKEEKMERHELFHATMVRKASGHAYAKAKAAFEKERSNENQRKVKDVEKWLSKGLAEFRNQESRRARERLRELQTLYPEVSVEERVLERQRTKKVNLENLYADIEKKYHHCVREQEHYWKEVENKEAEYRENGEKVLSAEEVSECLQRLEDCLETWSKKLTKAEESVFEMKFDATEKLENKVLSDVTNRLEILCEDAEEMIFRIEEIEMTLRMVELPLLFMKNTFEKASLQYNSCKEMLAKVEPQCKESPTYRSSQERLERLNQDLQTAYTNCQERLQGFSDLESEVRTCRDHLREQMKHFEVQGLNFINEELLWVGAELFTQARLDLVATVPYMEFYLQYHNIKREKVRSQWMAKTERYREIRQAFQGVMKEDLLAEDTILKEEDYWLLRDDWLLRDERKNR